MSNLLYKVSDKPKRIREWIVYIAQYFFCVLPATMLICKLCNTSVAAGLVSAGIGTLVFLIVTKMRCSMVTSNSGTTVSAIVGTFALSKAVDTGFTGVVIGGVVMLLIYAIAALLVYRFGTQWLDKLMPPVVSGTTILVIGASLALFIPNYAKVTASADLTSTYIGLAVCFVTMIVAALIGNYCKGVLKTLPFLVAILFGEALCIVLTLCNVAPLVDFAQLNFTSVFEIPDFAFMHLDFKSFDWVNLPKIILMYGLVSLSAMTEHVADVTTAGRVAEGDYIKDPGLHRTLLGDGLSSLAGSLTGAQMTTTYSEYTGTMAVSGVASSWVTLGTALSLIAFGFISPVTTFLSALPNCVIAGISMLAYGAIACTGVNTLIIERVDFSDNRNLFIFGAMFTAGVSGLIIPISDDFGIAGVVLAMLVGILLNVILRKRDKNKS